GSVFIMMVTVNPLPQITNITHDVCSESQFEILPVNGINGVVPAGTTYSWGLPAVVTNITGYTSGTSQNTIIGMLQNDTTVYRNVLYQVVPAFDRCEGSPFDITVKVKPIPVIPSQNAKVCSGVDFTFLSQNIINGKIPDHTLYSWPNPTNSGGIVGMNGAQNGVTQIRDTFFNNVNAVATVTYFITPSTDGCNGIPFNTIVAVNPAAKINSIEYSICSGSPFSLKPSNGSIPPNTTYSWSEPSYSGVTGTTSGVNQDSIHNNPVNSTLQPVVLPYHVIPTSGSCVGNLFNVNVTVYPTPLVNHVADQQVCHNNEVVINFSSPTMQPGRSYYWKNNNPVIGLDSSGRDNISFTAHSTEGSKPDTAIVSVYSTYTLPEAEVCKGNMVDFQIIVAPALSVRMRDNIRSWPFWMVECLLMC
ncbi:MAG: PKD-like domain-containing protein, partial [Bacteroidales bacterium]